MRTTRKNSRGNVPKTNLAELWLWVEALDSNGQRTRSNDLQVATDIPVSLETLQGRELEVARQLMATASHRLRCYVATSWALAPGHYFKVRGQDYFIGHISTPENIDPEVEVESVITCGHEVPT